MSASSRAIPELSRVYCRNSDTATRTIAGETFVLAIRGEIASLDRMYVLDDVGLVIWNGLDGIRELSELVAQITNTFDVDPDTARTDALEFLERLREAGLVSYADEGKRA